MWAAALFIITVLVCHVLFSVFTRSRPDAYVLYVQRVYHFVGRQRWKSIRKIYRKMQRQTLTDEGTVRLYFEYRRENQEQIDRECRNIGHFSYPMKLCNSIRQLKNSVEHQTKGYSFVVRHIPSSVLCSYINSSKKLDSSVACISVPHEEVIKLSWKLGYFVIYVIFILFAYFEAFARLQSIHIISSQRNIIQTTS